MRAGISRVAVEVILLVLAVALALLIFSPVGSFIFSALGRTQLAGGTTTLEIISVNPGGAGGNLLISVKNQGPTDLPDSFGVGNWTVIVKNQTGEYTFQPSSVTEVGGDSDQDFDVGETWQLTVANQGQDETSTFTVLVYGPQGTRSEYIYRP